jgi:putative FmdB family regulatory protein
MAIADFKCNKCKETFTDIRIDKEEQRCPECGGRLIRVWTKPPAVIFRGDWTPRFYPNE